MLNFDALKMRYRPFPIGSIHPAMPEDLYAECLGCYPSKDLFEYIGDVGNKYSLSEKYAKDHYRRIIRDVPVWREFHRWVKSREFLAAVFGALERESIDLGYSNPTRSQRLQRTLKNWKRGRGRALARYSARFEFSMLPAVGGFVRPHTDNPEKVVTLVLSMVGEGEWDPVYGGGTDVIQPLDERLDFERLNDRRPDFSEFKTLHTFEFVPNQAVVFAKTFNSWHAVQPMTASDENLFRRSLTINIETS
jgi:hypothetical protein